MNKIFKEWLMNRAEEVWNEITERNEPITKEDWNDWYSLFFEECDNLLGTKTVSYEEYLRAFMEA